MLCTLILSNRIKAIATVIALASYDAQAQIENFGISLLYDSIRPISKHKHVYNYENKPDLVISLPNNSAFKVIPKRLVL